MVSACTCSPCARCKQKLKCGSANERGGCVWRHYLPPITVGSVYDVISASRFLRWSKLQVFWMNIKTVIVKTCSYRYSYAFFLFRNNCGIRHCLCGSALQKRQYILTSLYWSRENKFTIEGGQSNAEVFPVRDWITIFFLSPYSSK